MKRVCLFALISLVGCDLYTDDDCEPGFVGAAAPDQLLRNPETGQCESFGYGGGFVDGCGYDVATGPDYAEPNWPQCQSQCTGLGELDCMNTQFCQATYLTGGECSGDCPDTYYGCWPVRDYGAGGQACAGLDSESCSARDDCIRFHVRDDAIESHESDPEVGRFVRCDEELSGPPIWGTCDGVVTCDAIGPACPLGTLPGISDGCYTGFCIPNDALQCDTGEPGNCYGQVSCRAVAPDCPDGSLPGIENQCWTGFCIPEAACELAPECSDLTSEAQCLAAGSCSPLYTGIGCECTGDVCQCDEYLFQQCATQEEPH